MTPGLWVLLGFLILDVIGNGVLIYYKRKEKSLRKMIYNEIRSIVEEHNKGE